LMLTKETQQFALNAIDGGIAAFDVGFRCAQHQPTNLSGRPTKERLKNNLRKLIA